LALDFALLGDRVMADIEITQAEANSLIALEKVRENSDSVDYPGLGGNVCVPLVSVDKKEHFLLDMSRGKIDLLKGKYQTRGRHVIILVRLDFGGAPHRNPDGEEIPSPHLHLYRHGFGDKWATAVPQDCFPNTQDAWQMLKDFMRYCNITNPPIIQRGVFS
jgi:hypothetical protein